MSEDADPFAAKAVCFPVQARRQAGFQLGKVQARSGMYIAKFEEAVYVLHCFQKKTRATSHQDKGIAEVRYRAVVNARKRKP